MITWNAEKQFFHLHNQQVSYVLSVAHGRYLIHSYWGKRISTFSQADDYPKLDRSSFSPTPANWLDRTFSLDTVLQEYPGHGAGDYREPAFEVRYEDGSQVSNLHYVSHHIVAGKPSLEGLPATWVETPHAAETLRVTLEDPLTKLQVELSYTIFRDLPVIARSACITNGGKAPLRLLRALSCAVDFPDSEFEQIQFPGAWARERQLHRQPLNPGITVLDSKRGASSTHQQPFIGLVRPETTEMQGEAWGLHLVYSGNFTARTEVDAFQQTRVLLGINPHGFGWALAPDASFQTPEAILAWSDSGLNGLSHALHTLYRDNLVRGEHRHKVRPVLANNWESTYFDFNEEKLLRFADNAKALGAELLMLDDGWFGERNDDTSSLGDWFVNRQKFPNGLRPLIDQVHQQGMQFGLWFEPEMISRRSELFAAHPDWVLHAGQQPLSEGRNQYILDLGRPEVRDNILQQMRRFLDAHPVDYIKWDMNRNMTEVGSATASAGQQQETAHRYILGLYALLEALTERFPHILFECCAGGGGRFDPGMLFYMPQAWVSDNTDAASRVHIQYSTSMMYPPVMQCAHVSEVPNHQMGRSTSMMMRGAVAMSGNYGLMLDLMRSDSERDDAVRQQIAFYKQHRQLIQFGTFWRLVSPWENTDFAAWMFVSEDQQEALLMAFSLVSIASAPLRKVRLAGLDPAARYQLNDGPQSVGGDELMFRGIFIDPPLSRDYISRTWHLTRLP
ncbi:alpha-galactosidase [Scandinavium goeteborgense]|uniref:alpha-galactosidase n=1 Tax=Scandinavium goeteborgense TaxID=1851514 RepID=UPI0021655738|nr:alpha-galactosidase [Scandinavium goeteborgense]MCS2155333.1 alpha-galactosidase [Scandinavium goeteborgense]